MTAPRPDWVEQARRLAAELATDHPGLTDALGGLLGSPSTDRPADAGGECRSCPLCAALAALRGRRPDLIDALADVLAGAATALRITARTPSDGSAAAPDAPAPEPSTPPEETVPHPAPAPTVQRIVVA